MDDYDISAEDFTDKSVENEDQEDDLESNLPLLSGKSLKSWRHRGLSFSFFERHTTKLYDILAKVFFIASFIILAITVFGGDVDRACLKRMTGWSPLLDVLSYESKYLDPAIPNIYTGEWNPESAQAWNEQWHYGAIGISDDKLPLLNKTLTETSWDRWGDDSPRYPGQVKAFFEGFHRLHCVYLARMYAFRDSYDFSDLHYWKVGDARLLRHVEHCIENMRWGIECNADVTPYLFERFVGAGGKAEPRLSLARPATCLRIEDMWAYARENSVGGLLPLLST